MGRCTKRLGRKAAFASKPVCIQRKEEKDKKTVGRGSQKDMCGETRNLFSNCDDFKIPQDSHCRGAPFLAFLLVNQLPLSVMAVHAQYRATVPLSKFMVD